MKILVTGATGYIGSHVVMALAEEGYTVTGTDYNLDQNNISKYVDTVIPWDIRAVYNKILPDFDTVIHLAAKTMVEPSVTNPADYYNTNIFGTINVADIMKNSPHFIYCSTGAAINPSSSPYAMSKRASEDIVSQLDKFTICRFYNVCGNNGFKKFDDGYYHLMRKAAATLNGKFSSMNVYGRDYDTPDGTAIRNYTHIKDIVSSIVSIVKHGPTQNIENLGNEHGYSVAEVINAMEEVSGKKMITNYKERRKGDTGKSVLPNQSKFFNELCSLKDQCLSALENEI